MSRHREAFEELAEKAEEELGDSLEKLILYGSVARDEQTEESDIDVFAVVGDESQIEVLRDLAFDVSVDYGVFIVPLIKTSEEFEDKRETIFIREVENTGEVYV